jgi:hypothetical protein
MKLLRLLAAALLVVASVQWAAAQPLGAANSTATSMATQTADHVAITGGTIAGATITATSPVLTTPTITGGTITGATISAPITTTAVKTTAAVTANATTTYANVTGLTYTVVPGTYKFTLMLPSTVASGTGGIKYAFNYTGTVLSSIEASSQGFTASAVAVQHTTTTTTQTDLFTQAAVVIFTEIEGTMVVTTGGTIDVQMAQNTSNASNTVALVGGTLQMTRIS